MRRRESQSACPSLVVVEHDPVRDARSFEPVVRAVSDLSPSWRSPSPAVCRSPPAGPSRYLERRPARRSGGRGAGGGARPCRCGGRAARCGHRRRTGHRSDRRPSRRADGVPSSCPPGRGHPLVPRRALARGAGRGGRGVGRSGRPAASAGPRPPRRGGGAARHRSGGAVRARRSPAAPGVHRHRRDAPAHRTAAARPGGSSAPSTNGGPGAVARVRRQVAGRRARRRSRDGAWSAPRLLVEAETDGGGPLHPLRVRPSASPLRRSSNGCAGSSRDGRPRRRPTTRSRTEPVATTTGRAPAPGARRGAGPTRVCRRGFWVVAPGRRVGGTGGGPPQRTPRTRGRHRRRVAGWRDPRQAFVLVPATGTDLAERADNVVAPPLVVPGRVVAGAVTDMAPSVPVAVEVLDADGRPVVVSGRAWSAPPRCA